MPTVETVTADLELVSSRCSIWFLRARPAGFSRFLCLLPQKNNIRGQPFYFQLNLHTPRQCRAGSWIFFLKMWSCRVVFFRVISQLSSWRLLARHIRTWWSEGLCLIWRSKWPRQDWRKTAAAAAAGTVSETLINMCLAVAIWWRFGLSNGISSFLYFYARCNKLKYCETTKHSLMENLVILAG